MDDPVTVASGVGVPEAVSCPGANPARELAPELANQRLPEWSKAMPTGATRLSEAVAPIVMDGVTVPEVANWAGV